MTQSADGPTGPADPAGIDLLFLFNQASYALSAEMTAALAKLGITPRDHCVLSKALTGDRTQREIAELALLDKTTMVSTIDALEAAGLAERRPSPTDRRARLVAVTPKGRRVAQRAQAIIDELTTGVLDTLPQADRRALVTGLTQLVDDRLSAPSHVAVTAGTSAPRRRRVSSVAAKPART